jgi:hypothetical protein
MKTLIISALTFLMSFTPLQAQTGKGTFSLGLFDLFQLNSVQNISAFVGSHQEGKENNFVFAVSPMGSYFLMDNFSIGVRTFYQYKNEDENYSNTKDGVLGWSFFSRFYFGKSKFKPYGHVGCGFQKIWRERRIFTENYNWHGNSWVPDFGLGLAYFVSPKFSLDGMAAYTVSNTKMNFEDKGEPWGPGNYERKFKEFNMKLSLIYYLGKQVEN